MSPNTHSEPEPLHDAGPVWQRRQAVAIAGYRGDTDTASDALSDPDPSVRRTALGALRRSGALSDAQLHAALVDPAPLVRARAVVLAIPAAAAGRCSLLGLLLDEDPLVAEAAAFAIGECAPAEPGAVARLAEVATDHPDALVREAAVAALGSLADPGGLQAVLTATTDRATVRRRAALALTAFDGPEVDAALHRLAEDRDWQVRQAAEDQLDDLA